MLNTILPIELQSFLANEELDFAVKAKRTRPLGKAWGMILFSLIWSLVPTLIAKAILGDIFAGKETSFYNNGVLVTASLSNLGPLLVPIAFIGLFFLIGVFLSVTGVIGLFAHGGWFVGTSKRLVLFLKGTTRSIDWEQFTGDVEATGNDEYGTINLKLRSGRFVEHENRPAEYVSDEINIIGIKNSFEIGNICQKRIKENDPTPVEKIAESSY